MNDAASGPLDDGFMEDDTTGQTLSFTVEEALHLERLDKILTQHIHGFSRSYLQQLIAQGAVLVSNSGLALTKPALRLKAGSEVSVLLRPTEQSLAYLPEDIPIEWVYQDEDWAVLYKPAGLVVHPGAGNWTGTLLNGLLAADARFCALPRAGIVHRLDKDTSGLMLVARSRSGMDALVGMIAERVVQREYWAIVQGKWPYSQAKTVDAPIGRDPHNRLKMAVVPAPSQAGKPAQTSFTMLQQVRFKDKYYTWIHAQLHTGRTHQIRVHLSHLGFPIVADTLYKGAPLPELGMERQALHAYSLRLPHPIRHEAMEFRSPTPEDFASLLAGLGFVA